MGGLWCCMNNGFKFEIISPEMFQHDVYTSQIMHKRRRDTLYRSAMAELAILAGGDSILQDFRGVVWERGRTKAQSITNVFEQLDVELDALDTSERLTLSGKMNRYLEIRGEAYIARYGTEKERNELIKSKPGKSYPLAYSDPDDLLPDTRHILITDAKTNDLLGGVRFMVSPEDSNQRLRFEGKSDDA